MVSEKEIEALEVRWNYTKNCFDDKVHSNHGWSDWWTTIKERYTEITREYHTLRHLSEMFWHYDRAVKEKWLERPELVSLAIFFHDLIYEGKNKQDEDASADAFEGFGKEMGMSADDIEAVSRWIRLTASHKCSVDKDGIDCALFMDFDMAILGKPWERSWDGCQIEGSTDDLGYQVRKPLETVVTRPP